ncbi:MAG: amidohydrolase family protein [Oscillospiraceae bacterium]|nr:amidohydrolase family protein [Oscillospiraceae bacterium]
MSKVFFTNGNIIDVVNEKIFNGSVIVENDVICAVGEDLKCPEGADVVDFGGNFVSPGLFNCHTHVLMSGEANPDYADSDAVLTIKALENCRKHLNTGVTFIRDVGGMNYIDIDIRNAAAKGMIDAPEMVVSGRNLCMTGGHGWTMGRECDGPDECRKAAREQLRAGADWVKIMATGGVMTKGVEPGSPQLTEEEMRAAIEEAHKVGKKTATHAQGLNGIKNALRAGIDSIEHGFYLDDWCYDWMKEHNVFFVPTLAAMYWIKVNGVAAGIPDWAVKKVEGAFEAHKASFLGAYKAGVKIALGTDAGTPFNPHDKTAYEMILMVEDGMAPWDAVKTGTVNAAELCGVLEDHGTIEVGKKANFTVYGGDPIADIHNVMDCRMTVIGGKVKFCK